MLYDTAPRQPMAELDAQGHITRQYLNLAELPLLVIDTCEASERAASKPKSVRF